MGGVEQTRGPGASPAERSVIDALHRAVIVTDPDGRIVLWNRSAESLYGWSEIEVLGLPADEVLSVRRDPDDDADEWRGDLEAVRRDGTPVRVAATIRSLVDGDGDAIGLVAVSEDVTDLRAAQQQAADLHEQLRVALDAGGLGTWRFDAATGLLNWDEREHRLFGLEPGTFDGSRSHWESLLHPDDRDEVTGIVRRALDAREGYVIEHRVVRPDGTIRWLRGNGRVLTGPAGDVVAAIGCTFDVTDQVELAAERERMLAASRAAEQRERLSRERLEFLTRINDAIAASRDRSEAMRGVTQAAVPRLGDWCAMYVLPDSTARVPEVVTSHADPQVGERFAALRDAMPYDPDATTGVASVIRTGATQFFPRVDQRVMGRPEVTDANRRVVEQFSVRSVITVPLLRPDRVIGAIQFVNSDSSRTYTDDDVLLAEAVASRVASGLDNLRLTEHQRAIATTLQSALLPADLPVVDGVDLAVRYWAAGEGTEVGGDFYDVFPLPGEAAHGERFALVIGDVCGTGPTAAATTGLARHTIRAAAWHGAGPGGVLAELNRAMVRSDRSTFCTAVYAEAETSDDGVVLDLAIGGHPFPILCRADGRVGPVGAKGTLIGVMPDARSETVRLGLGRGDVLVLYTDGITDVPEPHGIDDATMWEIVLESVQGAASAEDVADRVRDRVAAVLPIAERNDDIALLVVRASGS